MAGRVGVNVLAKFFGRLPGQTLMEFSAESKALSDEDFEQLKNGIENGSLNY